MEGVSPAGCRGGSFCEGGIFAPFRNRKYEALFCMDCYFCCFLFYSFFRREGIIFYSQLAALWCIQPQWENTLSKALQRTCILFFLRGFPKYRGNPYRGCQPLPVCVQPCDGYHDRHHHWHAGKLRKASTEKRIFCSFPVWMIRL